MRPALFWQIPEITDHKRACMKSARLLVITGNTRRQLSCKLTVTKCSSALKEMVKKHKKNNLEDVIHIKKKKSRRPTIRTTDVCDVIEQEQVHPGQINITEQ